MTTSAITEDYLATVLGQDAAITQLRAAARNPVHAYLFVGPGGCGKHTAALAFAATLLADERPLHGTHPDVVTVEREGASLSVSQAREISRLGSRSPVEGNRKVLILTDFHLVTDAAPALLKTIEEASPTTIFIVLAESVPHELVTVASRCVRIDFGVMSESVVEQVLMSEGVDADTAREAAANAFGNVTRARLLAHDDAVAARRELWSSILSRLDGTGATAASLSDEVIAAIDLALEPLVAQQSEERARIALQAKQTGQTAASAKDLDTRSKREQRRLRTDELRYGFAILARELNKRHQEASSKPTAEAAREGLAAVAWASESLTYNPNEALLLQGLFVRLSQLR